MRIRLGGAPATRTGLRLELHVVQRALCGDDGAAGGLEVDLLCGGLPLQACLQAARRKPGLVQQPTGFFVPPSLVGELAFQVRHALAQG